MQMTLDIPDGLEEQLREKFPDLGRSTLEALAARAYEQDVFGLKQVRLLLKLESRWEAQEVLSRHGVWPGTTVEDVRSDLANLDKFLASR